MSDDLPLRCRCGAVRGVASEPTKLNRVVCYCDDCQAFARFLGRDDLLDALGGSDICQMALARLRITEGREHLLGVRVPEPARDRDPHARPLRERVRLRARDPHQRRSADRLEAARHLLDQVGGRRPAAADVVQERGQIRGGFDGAMAREEDGEAHGADSTIPPHFSETVTLVSPSNPSHRTVAVTFTVCPASTSWSGPSGW